MVFEGHGAIQLLSDRMTGRMGWGGGAPTLFSCIHELKDWEAEMAGAGGGDVRMGRHAVARDRHGRCDRGPLNARELKVAPCGLASPLALPVPGR